MKQKQAHGHAKKHTGTKKHQQKHHGAKHHPVHQHAHHQPAKQHHHKTAHTVARHPHHTKARALSLGDVSCCAADALAWSLRLSGWPVDAADVLALYKLTADSPDAGASILATLDAAHVFGLAGVRPVKFESVDLELAGQWGQRVIDAGDDAASGAERLKVSAALDRNLADVPYFAASAPAEDRQPRVELAGRCGDLLRTHGLILGVDLPGPHAVCQRDGQWWTWGEPYDPCCFPDAVIEEAWAVTWP
ncbi:MAG: hypothetical protein JWO67_1272 [Streptosporangiaceae bacterium]|nr:hypothetical protein [Streptosporangiaceae bacterium]